jgi:hypothetical protein
MFTDSLTAAFCLLPSGKNWVLCLSWSAGPGSHEVARRGTRALRDGCIRAERHKRLYFILPAALSFTSGLPSRLVNQLEKGSSQAITCCYTDLRCSSWRVGVLPLGRGVASLHCSITITSALYQASQAAQMSSKGGSGCRVRHRASPLMLGSQVPGGSPVQNVPHVSWWRR